jgi:hypothetical protein
MAAAMSAAGERVEWLLRTLYDAREAWDGRADGDGFSGVLLLMPSDYTRGSYQELERCLVDMRDNGRRRLWWHATRRYRDGERKAIDVPVRRTQRGAVPILPRNCELVGGGVLSGQKRATVLVRRWPDTVRVELADAGVELLVATMYGGRRERIVLPPGVAAVAFGG